MTLKELVFMQKSNNPELNYSKYCILPFLELNITNNTNRQCTILFRTHTIKPASVKKVEDTNKKYFKWNKYFVLQKKI